MFHQFGFVQELAFVFVGQHDIVVVHDVEGQISGIAVFAVGDDVARCRLQVQQLQEVFEHHAFPAGIELAPAGDAVDIHCHSAGWQLQEFFPGPALFGGDFAEDAQVPVLGIEYGRRPVGQHRELIRQRLSVGQASRGPHGFFFFAPVQVHVCLVSIWSCLRAD